MKEYPVVAREDSLWDDFPQTLKYSKRYNGYMLDTSRQMAKLVELEHDEFMEFSGGNIKKFFPEYDPTTYSTEVLGYESEAFKPINTAPVALYKYKKLEENSLPFGCFLMEMTNHGVVLKKISPSSDDYIDLHHKFDLVEDFKVFRKARKFKKSKGQRNRKGVLFYGPPGNGKTAQVSQLCSLALKEKFRVIFIDNGFSLSNLTDFRDILQRDDSVFVLEEITERAGGKAAEELLSFMDGEMSWDNCYVIATTNHPEELPWNVVDRPSRFKVKLEFDNPNENERRIYLTKLEVEDVEAAVKATEGLSLDYIKNIVLDSFTENKTIPELIKEYKAEKTKIQNNFKKGKIGF